MEPVLTVKDLSVEFQTDDGILRAAENVSFSLYPGRVLGLVGESGCGKSVSAMSIPRLIPQPPGRITSGEIFFHGQNLLTLPPAEMRRLRGQSIGVIFQEPMTALSPLQKIGAQLVEACALHLREPKDKSRERGLEWLRRVGIPEPERCWQSYPFELSGGMRQRVMIAMAMILEPEIVIADEPTTALDVTIQAQILELMRGLRRNNSSLLLITHDLGVIWEMCDDVAVMYAAHVVEQAPREELFHHPAHPYTRGLLDSIPSLHQGDGPLKHIPGQVPSLLNPPPGCPFAPRCPLATDKCRNQQPELKNLADGHAVACWNSGK